MVDDTIEDAGRSRAGNAVLGGEQLIAHLGAGQEDVVDFTINDLARIHAARWSLDYVDKISPIDRFMILI